MTLNLNRAGIICTWSFWWRALLWAALLFLFGLDGTFSPDDIIFDSIFFLIAMFAIIRGEPKSVELGWHSAEYRDRVKIGRSVYKDVLFRLSGINSVTIYQNPIERLFGFGHMVIKCTLQFESSGSGLPPRKKHAFYGIEDIEHLCDEIGAFFPSDIIHIKVFGMAR
ncbi:MAG: hypothetical protein IJW21_06935 [Clostridia bacterium]|nr:hypothetical protein [Clostridia bacterium]